MKSCRLTALKIRPSGIVRNTRRRTAACCGAFDFNWKLEYQYFLNYCDCMWYREARTAINIQHWPPAGRLRSARTIIRKLGTKIQQQSGTNSKSYNTTELNQARKTNKNIEPGHQIDGRSRAHGCVLLYRHWQRQLFIINSVLCVGYVYVYLSLALFPFAQH